MNKRGNFRMAEVIRLLYYLPIERMTPDTDKREWLGKWIYAIFVQNYEKLLEENKKLREKLDNRDLLLEWKRKEVQTLFMVNKELTAENKKLKETIKDHQLYEEKLEHRIIELEELLHWD